MISVIMPVYNVAQYLEQSIESVLAQTSNKFELIIVNDGSTDNSEVILSKYKNNKMIKIYHQSNQGLSAARNTGLKYAKGDIIYFFDSDDLLNRNLFKYILERFENNDSDLISFNYREFNDGEDVDSSSSLKTTSISFFNRNDALKELLNGQLYQMAWSYFVKKKILLQNHFSFSVGRLFEDNNSAAKIISYSNKIELIKFRDAPYLLRNRKNSITSNAYKNLSLRELEDELFVFKDEYKVCLENMDEKDLELVNHWYLSKLLHLYIKYHLSLLKHNPSVFYEIKNNVKQLYSSKKIHMSSRDRIRWCRVMYPSFDKVVRIVMNDKNQFR